MLVPTDVAYIESERAETLPLLIMVACSTYLAYPEPGDVRWFEALFPHVQYDGTPEFWSPYAITPGGVCVKPWAIAARSYLGRAVSGRTAIAHMDPAEWRENLDNCLSDVLYADQPVRTAIHLMREQYVHPAGELKLRQEALEGRARQAIASGSLVTDTAKAKAMIAATQAYLNGAP